MPTSKSLKLQRLIAIVVFVIGLALMIMMITTESEPGALPLALVVGSSAWYFITRARMRS